MLCGGMARTLEFVSRVLPENMVGLVDCIEWMSEKVDDFTEEEQKETKGMTLALSCCCCCCCLNLSAGGSSHTTLCVPSSSDSPDRNEFRSTMGRSDELMVVPSDSSCVCLTAVVPAPVLRLGLLLETDALVVVVVLMIFFTHTESLFLLPWNV